MRKHLGEYFSSFGIWGYVVLVLTILSIINAYSNITGNPIPIFTIVPTWGWLTLLVLVLVIAPFFAFHKIKTKLDNYENMQPNIVFDQFRETPLFRIVQPYAKGEPIYHVIQVWFKNLPITPMESSIAKQVTATIEFWENGDNPKQVLRIAGVWLISFAPSFAGIKEQRKTIDIFPNDESCKLLVALKWEDDDDAYGYATESFVHSLTQDGRDGGRKLPQGEYSVCVKLRGVGVDKLFWFTLINPGKGKSLELQARPHT